MTSPTMTATSKISIPITHDSVPQNRALLEAATALS